METESFNLCNVLVGQAGASAGGWPNLKHMNDQSRLLATKYVYNEETRAI